MSTAYDIRGARGKKTVSFKRLRNDVGQGKIPGLSLDKDSQKKNQGCVTDGTNFIHCYDLGTSNVSFERYGQNDVSGILNKIAKHYEIRIVSEHGDDGFPIEDDELEVLQEATKALHTLMQRASGHQPNKPRKMEK